MMVGLTGERAGAFPELFWCRDEVRERGCLENVFVSTSVKTFFN